MRKYIYYSTLMGVFSAALVYKAGINFRLFYLILLSNGLLIALLVKSLRIPRWMVWMVAYLLLSGLVGIARGTDDTGQFLKEFIGIVANALFYYLFFRLYKNDYMRAFKTYARISYVICIIGFPILLFESLQGGESPRLHSIASEPAAFCELVLPAYFWYASNYLSQRKNGKEVLVFSLAIALSASSLGYLSVAVGVFLLPFRRRSWLLITPILVFLLLVSIYSVSSNFRMRFNDTMEALTVMQVSTSNVSTFSLVSNMIVTERVFQESPWIGNGLGSHVISHHRLIGDVPGMESVTSDFWFDVNADEAGSLALRLLSEQGILGLAIVLWFIARFHAGWHGQHAIISNALITCFFLKLIRSGTYFGPEQFFFVFIYLLNYRSYKMAQTCRPAAKKALTLNQVVRQTAISPGGKLIADSSS